MDHGSLVIYFPHLSFGLPVIDVVGGDAVVDGGLLAPDAALLPADVVQTHLKTSRARQGKVENRRSDRLGGDGRKSKRNLNRFASKAGLLR